MELEKDIMTGEICLIALQAVTLVVTIIIACIYYGQLVQMRNATNAATNAATTAGQQFVSSQRPWLGLKGQLYFTQDPEFLARNTPRPAETPANTALVKLAYAFQLENSGNSPARNVQGGFYVHFVANFNESLTAERERLNDICTRNEGYIARPETIPQHPPIGIVMPKGGHDVNSTSISWVPNEANEIRKFWITGCFVYQDTIQKDVIHHTKYLMRAIPADNAIPSVVASNPQIVMYWPLKSVEIVDSDAD